jgi:hypothetical protein
MRVMRNHHLAGVANRKKKRAICTLGRGYQFADVCTVRDDYEKGFFLFSFFAFSFGKVIQP